MTPASDARSINLSTSYPSEECARRLQAFGHEDVFDWNFPPGALVRIKGERVRIRIRRERLHNAFAPFFYGRIEATAEGAVIRGRFRMSTFTRCLLGVWFSLAALIALFSIVYSGLSLLSGDKTPGENHVLGLIFPPAFIAFAGLGLWFSKWLSRKDRQSILEFLHVTLGTTAADTAVQQGTGSGVAHD